MSRGARGLRRLLLASLLSSTAVSAAHAADEATAVPANDAGTTIVGERETAVGLYLMPWQEEAPSDIDRPPARFSMPLQAVDAKRLQAQTASDEANAAYRRVRTEPR